MGTEELLPRRNATTDVPTELLVSITRDLGALVQAQKSMEINYRRHVEEEMRQSDKLWHQYGEIVERTQKIELSIAEVPTVTHEHAEFLHALLEKEKAKAAFWRKLLASLTEKGVLALLGMALLGLFIYAKNRIGAP